MSQALTQPELFARLHAGQSFVLPHSHAARTLHARYMAAWPELGPSENPGTLLAWHEWTRSFWPGLMLDGREERVLLNRAQEDQLWTDVIASQGPDPATSSRSSTHGPHLARTGLQLVAAYNATERLRSAADSFDTRTFASWVNAFREVCTRQRLLAPALLDGTLAHHLRAGSLAPPGRIELVGFENFTPAQRDLLAAFRRAGADVYQSRLIAQNAPANPGLAFTTRDTNEQLYFAVRWIKEQAAHAPGTFALVTPRTEEHQPALQRLLRQHLAPELDSVAADLSSTPWQFARNAPLRSSSVALHAISLLQWIGTPLPLERIGQLLLSPYFAHSDLLETRARFEVNTLRNARLLRPELDLFQFLDLLQSAPRKPNLARFPELQALTRLADPKLLRSSPRLHADWADRTRSFLSALGWPGSRALTANESLAADAWDSLLDLLSTLDRNGRRVSFEHFVQHLEAELGQTTAPAPLVAAPVQILTLAEAEAIPFDHVLILDATDRDLPVAERPHPLLPRRLQTSMMMPGVDHVTSYARARGHLQNLITRSGSVHLLAPAEDVTGPLHLTRLAQDLGFHREPTSSAVTPQEAYASLPLTEIEDTGRLPELDSPAVHGGARVLELQAACGFRAFADLRLRAEEPQSLTLGPNAREAGRRLHEALHRLWLELGTQAHLRSLPTHARHAAVEGAVEAALRPLATYPGADRPWTQAFLNVLHDRYTDLLTSWLGQELERAPFETIAGEQEATIAVGPLALKIRPDRIDKVEGGLVYIDYKTKLSLSQQDWLGSRPEAPQLPLYTLLAEPGEVRGLAFGRVRPGKDLGWISLSDTPGIFPDKRGGAHDLAAEAEFWREELTRLAQAFAHGQTDVDPKSFPKTCEFCAFRLLCRLNPEELLDEAREGSEATEEETGV